MTIKEIGDIKKWMEMVYERVEDRIDQSCSIIYPSLLHLYVGSISIEMQMLKDFNWTLRIVEKTEGAFRMYEHILMIAVSSERRVLCDDTEGISILVDRIIEEKPGTVNEMHVAYRNASSIYNEQFRGKIAGNRFGF